MPILNLEDFLKDIHALQDQVAQILTGLEDMQGDHLSADESARLLVLINEYHVIENTIEPFASQVQALLDVGYPHLPTLDIPEVMKEHLLKEQEAAKIAAGFLHGIVPATSGTFEFGPAIEKKA
jgi:hypothetical protein